MMAHTENPDVWVGIKRCGCCVAVMVDAPEIPRKDVDKAKRQFLKEGLSVVRATWQEWQEKYMPVFLSCKHESVK